DLQRVTTAAWSALERANSPARLFMYGRSPVRLQIQENGSPTLKELNVDRLRHEVARGADWFCVGKDGKERPALPPVDVVRDMLASSKIPIPILKMIARVPIISPDGAVITVRGYHPESQILYVPPPELRVPQVPDEPTYHDVEMARSLLLESICDFPF